MCTSPAQEAINLLTSSKLKNKFMRIENKRKVKEKPTVRCIDIVMVDSGQVEILTLHRSKKLRLSILFISCH